VGQADDVVKWMMAGVYPGQGRASL
jgi:hypothetical protein